MHYIEFDVNNFRRWLAGAIGANGAAGRERGWLHRLLLRSPHQLDGGGNETGEYGFEDIVNLADANGAPNGELDAGEDLNGNNALEVYGGAPASPPGWSDVGGLPANLAANEAARAADHCGAGRTPSSPRPSPRPTGRCCFAAR